MVLIVAVVGKSGSGKTVTIEYLISQFSAENYKVGAIKHVHHKGFTMDTEGKNTWRYAKAGAKVIAAVSPDEVAVIKKTVQEEGSFDWVIEMLKEDSLDVIFVEGYYGLIAKRGDVAKIVVLRDNDDTGVLRDILRGMVGPVIAISGLFAEQSEVPTVEGYPVIRVPKDGRRLVELIKRQLVIQTGAGF